MAKRSTRRQYATAASPPAIEPIALSPAGHCPQCGDEFQPAPGDTASDEQRAALGVLYRCSHCGYKTRVQT